jgi:hypothetical protein
MKKKFKHLKISVTSRFVERNAGDEECSYGIGDGTGKGCVENYLMGSFDGDGTGKGYNYLYGEGRSFQFLQDGRLKYEEYI